MLIVISPAKSLDMDTPAVTDQYSQPELITHSMKLVERLKKKSPGDLSKLMGISSQLGELNFQRYQLWEPTFTFEDAKQAILAFSGDVYRGLDAGTLTEGQFKLAQKRLRILSGLYGVLKPLDLIRPYRLEMGTPLNYYRKKDLYAFWEGIITNKIHEALRESGNSVLVNLASKEYFKSIDTKRIKVDVVTPVFKDMKNGEYKMISFFAKKARGLMTRFILENDISDEEDLLAFEAEGYMYNPGLSKPKNPVFTRDN